MNRLEGRMLIMLKNL